MILLPFFGFSQAPQKINFQSILRNSSGEVIGNKSVSLKISILSGSINSSSVYSETHAKTTDASGLISLQIGNGTVLSGVFANIGWGDFPHFIKLEADFSGGSNYVLLGTQELMSVPYALYASKTDTSSLNLVNRFNSKVNVSDTSNMLTNYRNGLNAKINTTDTSTMLSNYLRKADDIIADLQFQIKQLQSLSNVVDIDGNSYKTVKIGSQIWMSENLKTSRFRNGDSIPIVTDDIAWKNLITGGRCWYNNDSTAYEIPYGNLYNWFAVADNRNICPTSWHVPSDAEWTILIEYLGLVSEVGGKLKSIGTTYWDSPNYGATNESGFSALPAGLRIFDGSFEGIGVVAWFRSASEYNYTGFSLYSWGIFVHRSNASHSTAASIRCLKD